MYQQEGLNWGPLVWQTNMLTNIPKALQARLKNGAFQLKNNCYTLRFIH